MYIYTNYCDVFATIKIVDRIPPAGDGGTPHCWRAMEYEIDTDEPASVAVVRAVSAYTDTSTTDLDALYHVVDPEALNALVSGPGSERGREIRFRYNGITVTATPTHVYLNEEPVSTE